MYIDPSTGGLCSRFWQLPLPQSQVSSYYSPIELKCSSSVFAGQMILSMNAAEEILKKPKNRTYNEDHHRRT